MMVTLNTARIFGEVVAWILLCSMNGCRRDIILCNPLEKGKVADMQMFLVGACLDMSHEKDTLVINRKIDWSASLCIGFGILS